jgi:hypothetical protein
VTAAARVSERTVRKWYAAKARQVCYSIGPPNGAGIREFTT